MGDCADRRMRSNRRFKEEMEDVEVMMRCVASMITICGCVERLCKTFKGTELVCKRS